MIELEISHQDFDTYWHYVNERNSIYHKRKAGLSAPWTTDPILGQYRFCQNYRELDAVTLWVKEHIRDKYYGHPDFIALLSLARFLNEGEIIDGALAGAVSPTGVDWDRVKDNMWQRKQNGQKLERMAYMLNAVGSKDYRSKMDMIIEKTLIPLSTDNDLIVEQLSNREDTLESYLEVLIPYKGMGGSSGHTGFINNQILIDLAHTPMFNSDWYKHNGTRIGPGSVQGLDYIFTDPGKNNWYEKFQYLQAVSVDYIDNPPEGYENISIHDIQNTCCEISKYFKHRYGEKCRIRRYKFD